MPDIFQTLLVLSLDFCLGSFKAVTAPDMLLCTNISQLDAVAVATAALDVWIL
jgi:hypothetical protein